MAKENPKTDNVENESAADKPKICFVVMPYGLTEVEINWFAGWYKEVIKPAVETAGYKAVLSAEEHKPTPINDDIRSHLVRDPMVVVDLGGMTRDDAPNPNVMYELGIRHAAGMAHVLMAWKGQRLPFDIHNQRVIMEDRTPYAFQTNREKLTEFMGAAGNGEYYRPMETLKNIAALEAVTKAPVGDELIQALTAGVLGMQRKLDDFFERESQAENAAANEKRYEAILGSQKNLLVAIDRQRRGRTILDVFREQRPEVLAHALSLVDRGSENLAHQLLAQPLTRGTASMAMNGDAEDIKQWLANGGVKFLAS